MKAKAPSAKKSHLIEDDETSGEEDIVEDLGELSTDPESNSDNEGENNSENESGDESSDGDNENNTSTAPIENPFFGEESGDDSEVDDSNEDSDCDDESKEIGANEDSNGVDDNIEKSIKVQLGKRKKEADSDSDDDSWDDSDSDSDDNEDEKKVDTEEKGEEETDKDEEFLKAFREAREKRIRPCPPDIKLKSEPSDMSFHPTEDLLCVANIDGEISFFRFSNEENKIERKIKLHSKAIRCMDYSMDGTKIISGGKDKSVKVLNVETGKVIENLNWKHPSSMYSICAMEQGVATGDEDGMVKIWDYRTEKWPVFKSKRFDEYVSNFYLQDDNNRIIASSGEGTIQSWDLRMNKAEIQSEVFKSELNALVGVKEDQKLAVASADGWIYLFGRGEYGIHSDEYRGHPGAINSMVAVTETIVITGCEDGVLRAVNLFPHRFIGTVGHHPCEMPVEKIEVSGGRGNLIASMSHDSRIKFWDIGYFEDMEYKKVKPPTIHKSKHSRPIKSVVAKEREHQLQSSNRQNRTDFFKGFDD